MAKRAKQVEERGVRAVLYVRCSTDEQAASGLGLDDQEQKLLEYARFRQLEVVGVIRDAGVSGSVEMWSRPGGAHLRELMENGKVDHVVGLKLDRCFRDAQNALAVTNELERRGIALHIVDMGGESLSTGGAIGKLMFTMMCAFAEFERNIIRERTSAALQVKSRRGERIGRAPLGFRGEGEGTEGAGALVEVPDEQKVVARIVELRAQGLSYADVAEAANAEGLPTKRNGKWGGETVRLICRRAEGNPCGDGQGTSIAAAAN